MHEQCSSPRKQLELCMCSSVEKQVLTYSQLTFWLWIPRNITTSRSKWACRLFKQLFFHFMALISLKNYIGHFEKQNFYLSSNAHFLTFLPIQIFDTNLVFPISFSFRLSFQMFLNIFSNRFSTTGQLVLLLLLFLHFSEICWL